MTAVEDAPLSAAGNPIGFGRMHRKEDVRFLRGQGNYVDDVNLPGMLHSAILRSPYAHARIVSIDTSAALALPGVHAVITGETLAGLGLAWMPTLSYDTQAVLATDKVRFQGQEVAFVVADNRYIARDALELIDVEYDPLPAVVDAKKALDPDAPIIRDDKEGKTDNVVYEKWEAGDEAATDAAFAAADVVVTEDILYPRVHPAPMETCGSVSYLDKVTMTPPEFYRELERNPEHPKTSQPPPGDFRRHFEFLASHFDAVVSVNVSRQASGTCTAAESAAGRVSTHGKVTVVDSMNASLGQGLVVMYAAECAQAGYDAARVIEATRAILPRTHTYGLVGSLEYPVRGGRVPRWVKNVADRLQLMPILHNDRKGRVSAGGVLVGRRGLKEKFARLVRRRMRADRNYRLLVGHANCEADGRWLLERLADRNVVSATLLPLGSALGAHGGPGMLVVGLQEYEPPR